MKKLEFDSLKIPRATDIIENRISKMIFKGTIKPGDKLPTEKELSEQFDVSIVTVREAMRGLEVAGLIEKKRGKGGGIYVREINSDALRISLHNFLRRRECTAHHLAQVRLTIEPTIIKIAIPQITADELQALEDNLSYCENEIEKAKAGNLKEYHGIGEKSLEFHKLIAHATHNPVFSLTMDYLLDFIYNIQKDFFEHDIELFSKVLKEHRDILKSVKEGDVKEAERKMLSHLKYLEGYQTREHSHDVVY